MRPSAATLALVLGAVLLGGCAIGQRNFSCQGLPAGITCMSAVDVYNSTHGDATDKGKGGESTAPVRTVTLGGITPPPDRPVPVRTDPEILRVLVYPWEDESGYLNIGGYVFAEVTPRRWAVGDVPHASTRVLHSINDSTAAAVPATAALQEPAQAQQPAQASRPATNSPARARPPQTSNTRTGADPTKQSGASNR